MKSSDQKGRSPRRPPRPALELRLQGELTVRRGDEVLALPPSKKTRALLAYLVLTGRPQRRERLCSLFWDVTDDPRGALRWSLSRLRPLLDEPAVVRIVADRESVAFAVEGARVDVLELRRVVGKGLELADTETLLRLANELRGDLLEGLELPDFEEFQSWCVAEREQVRLHRSRLLAVLIERLADDPEAALPHTRARLQLDPLDDGAVIALFGVLGQLGRRAEAEQHYRAARRLRKELGVPVASALEQAWECAARSGPPESSPALQRLDPPPAADLVDLPAALPTPLGSTAPVERPLVGREVELERLEQLLEESRGRSLLCAVLLTGEPGAGKTRLLDALAVEVRRRGGTVLRGASFESETGRPYGPWIDGLRQLPIDARSEDLGGALAPLLPGAPSPQREEQSRERLFEGVVGLLASRAEAAPPLLLLFDDVQWLDGASASLIHYVCRMSQARPVVLAMAARAGELGDNARASEVVRALRRDHGLKELRVGPLDREATARLVRELDPELAPEAVFSASGGNPLYVLELTRAGRGQDGPPGSLADLVRDRLGRLSPDAREILGWASVLAHSFDAQLLGELSGLGLDRLLGTLEELERHAFLGEAGSADPGAGEASEGQYAFVHDVVRVVVHGDLSEPRRRLMHRRIAALLQERARDDDTHAAELARHAGLAGDLALATRACVRAGRHCLRLFANHEAEAVAKKGLRYAQRLPETERVTSLLELAEVRYRAHRPEDIDAAATTVEELAYRALDLGQLEHARLGFFILSQLRWEDGQWTQARQSALKAEAVSRTGEESQRVRALAEAGRCLAMLERDLGQAESLLREAQALSARVGSEYFAVPAALGMLRLHRGEVDEAVILFERARLLAQRERDSLGEFQALEQLTIAELQRGDVGSACALTQELTGLAARLRAGSELPFARALAALCASQSGDSAALDELEQALTQLEQADAKNRLAFTRTRAALLHLARGDAARARELAERALSTAELAGRPSEIALARVALARAAAQLDDPTAAAAQVHALRSTELRAISHEARESVRALVEV